MSSKYSETFTIACKYIEELLRHIYDEYKTYCRKKGYKEVDLLVKKLEMSQANSLQSSFYSDYLPQAENSTYNSSFLTSSNNNSFNLNPRFNEFMPAFINNDRFNRAAIELEGANKNLSSEDYKTAQFKGKSYSFQGSNFMNETEEEKSKRKEKRMNAWKEKYGQTKKNQN